VSQKIAAGQKGETRLEMLNEGEPETDIARAWLQAGQGFPANIGDETFLLYIADLIAPIVNEWRLEAGAMAAGTMAVHSWPKKD
jgi:hypothetical protein